MSKATVRQRPKPGPEHRRLEPLIGLWNTSGTTIATASESAVRFSGTDSYEWLDDGFFVLHRIDVSMGGQPVIGVEIIWYDPSTRTHRAHSIDISGRASASRVGLDGRECTIEGESERFAGTFSEDWRALSGRWTRLGSGSTWEPWMDVTLRRATPERL